MDLDEADAQGLVPALVFLSPDGDTVVDGSVTERTPSSFRLDVARAPPDSTVIHLAPDVAKRLGLRGSIAEALLALLPAAHPSALPNEAVTAEACDDTRTLCTKTTSACVGGTCRERTYDCVRSRCEELGTSGAETTDQGYFTQGIACAGGACYQSVTSCTPMGDCAAKYSRCGFDDTRVVVEWGSVVACTLVGESGDSSIMTLSDVPIFATTHYVTYLTEDNPGFNGLDLSRGYNVVESRLRSPAEYMEAVQCLTRVEFEVLAEYNAENGTTYDALTATQEIEALVQDRRDATCARATDARVVLDSLETPLVLELGPYPGL